MRGWSMVVKQTTVLFLLLAVGIALVLFSVKYQVQDLEDELTQLNRQIVAERYGVHVLRAELSYLTNADRLKRLSVEHLGLGPVEPGQLGTFASLREPLPPPPVVKGSGDKTGNSRARLASAR